MGKYNGDLENSSNTFEATMDKGKQYRVTFRQNRSFELHIRKTIYRFEPNGSLMLDESVINHPDFKQQSKYFIVNEV